ncbi:MAG: methylenetetrahydrofolate reductase, partial [Lentisphaeria bacterium]|nr:methylenetetrahydrofolate reductase [Lentisphaeria bacterium]
LPVIVRPNAGMPKSVDNRIFYMCSPEYFTTYAMRFVALGVHGVGGCCGTGPDHIRDMARSIRPLSRSANATEKLFVKEDALPEQPVKPLAERSSFGEKLAAKKWVQTVEVVPPQGYELDSTVEKARLCRDFGFDAVNLPDGPRASARIASIVAAARIQAEAGIETVLHVCCRDRNLIGIQADLLGCAALNIRNLLFITGDPPKLGDYPFASGVFDMDSIGLVKLQNRLNRGLDLAGKPIGKPASAVVGVGADPNAIDFKREIRRTQEKIDAGADFVVTQPVFDIEPLLRFMDAVPGLAKIPLIAGIWPLASYRNAEFMRNEVPGVIVPDSIMERMARGSTKEEQRSEGIQIAREAVAAIRDRVAGVQVSAPFGNVKTAAAVIQA